MSELPWFFNVFNQFNFEKAKEDCCYRGFRLVIEPDINRFDVKCCVWKEGIEYIRMNFMIPYDSLENKQIANQDGLDKAIVEHFHKVVDEYWRQTDEDS